VRTLDEVKGACRVDDETGCWEWTGAVDRGLPKVYAPDFTRAGGDMRVQVGRRALWHIVHGAPLPRGWRVYAWPGRCTSSTCMNPEHTKAGTTAQWGRDRARSDQLKGNVRVLTHLRRLGQQRSALSHEAYVEVIASDETGAALARRLKVSESTVSKARRGRLVCFQPLGGLFSGLIQQGARP